jgi:hypothetical protein
MHLLFSWFSFWLIYVSQYYILGTNYSDMYYEALLDDSVRVINQKIE